MKNRLAIAVMICAGIAPEVFAVNEGVPKGPAEIKISMPLAPREGGLMPSAVSVDPLMQSSPVLGAGVDVSGVKVEAALQQPASVVPGASPMISGRMVEAGAPDQGLSAEAVAADPKDKPTLAALKREVKELSGQMRTLLYGADMIAVGFRDAPSRTAAESASRMRENASTLDIKIQAKRGDIAKIRESEGLRHAALKAELASLKTQRSAAAAAASSVGGAWAAEYRGGAGEARGRLLEEVSALDGRIAAKKNELGLIERDHPSFAGLRAPLVMVMDMLGMGPMTAQEGRLKAEIKELSRRSVVARLAASQMGVVAREYPSAAEAGARQYEEAARLDREIALRREELKKLR